MNELINAFRGKKICITGTTGYKGSWLTFLLDSRAAITKGLSLQPKANPSLYNERRRSVYHQSIIGDICDYDFLIQEIISFKTYFIFHLSAQPIVYDSYETPKLTFETNFNGTLNALEILKEFNGRYCLNRGHMHY